MLLNAREVMRDSGTRNGGKGNSSAIISCRRAFSPPARGPLNLHNLDIWAPSAGAREAVLALVRGAAAVAVAAAVAAVVVAAAAAAAALSLKACATRAQRAAGIRAVSVSSRRRMAARTFSATCL